MPIPPEIKRKYYSYDWRTKIRPAILQRANHCCERCHRPWKPLDVAHLDGDPANREETNLAALCRKDHRSHDYEAWAKLYRAWLQRQIEERIDAKDAERPILVLLQEAP